LSHSYKTKAIAADDWGRAEVGFNVNLTINARPATILSYELVASRKSTWLAA
jgi:hypothetical protein